MADNEYYDDYEDEDDFEDSPLNDGENGGAEEWGSDKGSSDNGSPDNGGSGASQNASVDYNKFITEAGYYCKKILCAENLNLFVDRFYTYVGSSPHTAFCKIAENSTMASVLSTCDFDIKPIKAMSKTETGCPDISVVSKAFAKATYVILYVERHKSDSTDRDALIESAEISVDKLLSYCSTESMVLSGFISAYRMLLGIEDSNANENSDKNNDSEKSDRSEKAEKSGYRDEDGLSDEEAIDKLGTKSELGDSLVDKVIEKIVNLAQRIYTRCSATKPVGIVYSGGMLKYDRGSRKIFIFSSGGKEEYFQNLYDSVNKFLPLSSSGEGGLPFKEYIGLYRENGGIDTAKLADLIFNDSLNSQYNYLPELALFISQGVLPLKDGSFHHFNNDATFKKGLVALLNEVFTSDNISRYSSAHGNRVSGLEVNALRILRNTFITLEFTKNQANFVIFKQGNTNMQKVVDSIKSSNTLYFSSGSKIFYSNQSNLSGLEIFDLVILMDEASYLQEVMFAYKAYEKMRGKPSLSSIVLGKRLNGKNMTFDFRSNISQRVAILAGSRSGKGVLTLNILVSFLANRCPLIYLDGKPDMAKVLWKLEKELQSKGYDCKILAVDCVNPNHELAPRTYDISSTVDTSLGISQSAFSIVPYLKAWQLSNLIVDARCNVKACRGNGLFNKNKKMFTVVDEILNANEGLGNLLTALSTIKAKKGSDLAEKIVRYQKFLTPEGLGIGQFISKDAGQGNAGYLILSQSCRMDSDVTTDPFKKILRGVQYSIKGRSLQKTNKTEIPNNLDGAEYINLDEKEGINITGYFALHSGLETPSRNEISVFKSYLVLNENDYKPSNNGVYDEEVSPYTAPLITRVCGSGSTMNKALEEQLVNHELTYVDSSGHRVIREEVGFAGLARSVIRRIEGQDVDADQILADTLSTGYKSAWYLMCLLGLNSKYADVEQYLYDVSPESVYSFDELTNCLIRGRKLIGTSSDSTGGSPFEKEKEGDSSGSSPFEKEAENSSSGRSESGQRGNTFENNSNQGDDSEEDSANDGSSGFGFDFEHPEQGRSSPSPSSVNSSGTGYSGQGASDFSPIPNPYQSYDRSQPVHKEMFRVRQSDNPFDRAFRSGSMLSSLSSIQNISTILIDNIRLAFGDLSRIRTFEVEESGKLVINGVLFQPELSDAYLSVLPIDIQSNIKQGYWVELFNFRDIYYFQNLEILSIVNVSTAEYKARNELRLGKKSWLSLKRKLHSLHTIIIGGSEIQDEVSEQKYESSTRHSFGIASAIRRGTGFIGQMIDPDSNSRSSRIWKSKGATTVKKVLGASLGTAAVWGAVSLFGFWGILGSALAVANVYKKKK